MARLNADLIRRSPQFISALKQRVLDLRGNRIDIIENLGTTEDQFDTIDLSHNEIVKLENFPFMNRLGTLLINNNRIEHINPNLGDFLPKMHTLELTNNRLTSLAEIDHLASLPKLQFLSLLDNTITKQPDYRLYVIHKLKHLHLLDIEKVKQQERAEAVKKFNSKEAEEATEKVAVKTRTPAVVDAQCITKEQGLQVVAPTPAQITAFKAAIMNSQMLDEVTRLEKALGTGQVPAAFVLPKLVTKMAEVSEEAEAAKMEADGQDQEDGADGQKQTDGTSIEEEMLGVGLDSASTEICHIQSYIYKNFQRADFNFIFSWRKRPFRGLHIIPPPRRQEPGDCAYHATLGIMECGFKVKYARRGRRKNREFNVRLSHDHLKKLVFDFLSSEDGKGFRLRDKLRVCLMVAKRYGVVSEKDFKDGCPPGAVRYKIQYYRELTDDEKEGIPDLLDKAKMVLTSFRVTPRYRSLLPHEIYRYLLAEDVVYQESISSSGSDEKKPMHESHCVVLTNHGLAYPALEEVSTEAELSMPERYFEYLNSYSAGYGVDGSGYIFSDSIHKCYTVVV